MFVEVLDHDEQEQNGQHEPVSQPELKTEMAPYYLLAIYGPYRGKRYQLRYSETKIGRDVKLNDVVIRQNKRVRSIRVFPVGTRPFPIRTAPFMSVINAAKPGHTSIRRWSRKMLKFSSIPEMKLKL